MSILITINGWTPETWLAEMRRLAPGRRLYDARGPFPVDEIRYAMCWRPQPGLLAKLPGLQAIFSLGAGVDHLMGDPALPAVPIVRVVDSSLTDRMTEWVALQVLAHHRQALTYAAAQRARRWLSREQWPAEAFRVGIMGLGVLGRAAAATLAPFRFPLAGWSRTPQDLPGVVTFHGEEGLGPFLARTDCLVVLLPLTPDTRGILDARLFERLARDGPLGAAVLVNAGRGGLQIEADILSALDSGLLAGVSLDVFETEPLPETSPLWAHPRAIVTPHAAADSDPKALCLYVLRQIERHEAGLGLENVIDRRRGY